eukprot:60444-Rhodomonas_salina.2
MRPPQTCHRSCVARLQSTMPPLAARDRATECHASEQDRGQMARASEERAKTRLHDDDLLDGQEEPLELLVPLGEHGLADGLQLVQLPERRAAPIPVVIFSSAPLSSRLFCAVLC